jgi:PAS domain S-box-containing protein
VSERDGNGDPGEGREEDAELRSLRVSLGQSDRLLQELRVHQIELEIQNRALSEAQEQLEVSRERYVDLFDFAPVAYLTLEADGRILEANIAASRMIGLDRSAMIGRRFQTLVGMTDPLAFRTILRRTSEMKQEGRTEVTFRTVSQQLYTVDMLVGPVPRGEDLGRVQVALHDVTARVTAEQNLRFLSQAGSRLSRIPLGTPDLPEEIAGAGAFGPIDGCWVELDGRETVAWRSDPVRRKMVGRTLTMLRLQIAPSVRDALNTGGAVAGRWTDLDVGSSPPPVHCWVTAPLRAGGSIRGTATLFQTMTSESEEAARALTEEFARRASMVLENAQLFRQAEAATRSRDEMMAVLAHDLSNALFSFRLHAQRGLSKGGEHAQRALGTVARGSQWLLGLVKTVLDVAGMDHGEMKVQPQHGNLSQVLESACLLQQMDADERRLHVHRSWPDDLSFEFDQERILQVLFNLMNNAVKFTPAGGRIEIGAAYEDEQIRIWVRDSGKGIGPGELERVFDRGWQADPKSGGKGLGLYIARRIVEAHGGTLWAESTAGRGTTFHVALPATPAATATPEARASASS